MDTTQTGYRWDPAALRAEAAERGVTSAQLAESAGVTPQAVRLWWSEGGSEPPVSAALALARRLRVPISRLCPRV